MAEWVNEIVTSSGGNVQLKICGGYTNVQRNGDSIEFDYGIRFAMSTWTWTSNSIAAFVDDERYYAFYGNSQHTQKDAWYYANSQYQETTTTPTCRFHWSGKASSVDSGSINISIGTGWNAYTPWNAYTYSFSVPYPAAATYTVSYNANGGSGAPRAQTKYQGYTLTLSSDRPTRSGYEFLGWSTSSSGNVKYLPGSSYTEDSEKTLYAVWKSLEPVFSAPSLSRTETTISWGSFSANINSDFYYRVNVGDDEGSWTEIGLNTKTVEEKEISSYRDSHRNLINIGPNTKYTIDFKAENASDISLQTIHSNSTTTYNYPYIQSIGNSNITIGSSQIISLYNPLSRSVSVSIYTVDEKTGTYGSAVSTTTTSATITIPTSAVATEFTTKTSAPIVYRAAYSGHTSDYSGTVNVTAATAGPTINESKKDGFFTYADVAIISGSTYSMSTYTGSDKKLLRGYSKIRYSLVSDSNPFGGQYGATINSYKVQINSKTATTTIIGDEYYEGSSGGVTESRDAVVVTDQNYTITISATDTRGLTNSYTILITTYSYSKPVVSISSAVRDGGFSENVIISISGTWCPNMNGIHTAKTITLSYKKTSDNTYTTKTLYQDNGGSTSYYQLSRTIELSDIDFDSNAAYEMYLTAIDGLGQSTDSAVFILSPGIPIMMIDSAQTGVGVNMLPEGKGLYTNALVATDEDGFNYRGIAEKTTNEDGYVWFTTNDDTEKGVPVYSDNFKYNPFTDELTVGSITGTAGSASKDGDGNIISSTYAKLSGASFSGNISAPNLTANNGYLYSTNNGYTIQIGSQNSSCCHYSTEAPMHWFNKEVHVQGSLYKGPNYNLNVPAVFIQSETPTASQTGDIWFL